jgi:hypothetical protein
MATTIICSIVVAFVMYWVGFYLGTSLRPDADILKYHNDHTPLPPAGSLQGHSGWPHDALHPERCNNADEWLQPPYSRKRVDGYEHEFYRQSKESAADVVRLILIGRELNAARQGKERHVETIDLRIAIKDGGYTIHTTIPRANYADDA